MDRRAWRAAVLGVAKSQPQLSDTHTHTHTPLQLRVCLSPSFSSLLFHFPQKDAHEGTVHPREASPWTESTLSSLPASPCRFPAVKDLRT